MKIDLRNDKGILGSVKFSARVSKKADLSDDELIAETLRRRHHSPETETASEKTADIPSISSTSKSKRSPFRELLLLIAMLAAIGYYLHDKGVLEPYQHIIEDYWLKVVGIVPDQDTSFAIDVDDTLVVEGVLSDDLFNALMPVTEDIAALADSIATIHPDSLSYDPYEDLRDSAQGYLKVAEEPIQLSDDDIKIINNRSILLMLTEIIGLVPPDLEDAHLFLKRDALRFTAPRSGSWVSQMKSTLDKFVLGTFNEDFSEGNAKISSKYEIIINAEQDFEAQIMDEMRLLDVLAHPFNEYLQQIVIDLARGVDNNPAKFTFAGTPQEMQYILSSWAETRSNYLLRSVDLKYESEQLVLSFDVIFFTYTP